MRIAFEINNCNWIEKENGILSTKVNEFLVFWNKEKNRFEVNDEQFLKNNSNNLVVLNIKTTMEKEIEDIINNSNLYNETSEYEVLFKQKGFEVICSNNDETREDNSKEVYWNSTFILEKNNKKFEVLIEGSSIADYSYGRWIDNSCPSIDNIEVLEQLK